MNYDTLSILEDRMLANPSAANRLLLDIGRMVAGPEEEEDREQDVDSGPGAAGAD